MTDCHKTTEMIASFVIVVIVVVTTLITLMYNYNWVKQNKKVFKILLHFTI